MNTIDRMKDHLLRLILAGLLLAAVVSPDRVFAASTQESSSTIDFVLVLDNSGTMKRSDPDGLTVAAAKMFIDMLPRKDARVAVIEFGADYGEAAFDKEQYSKYVSVPFPLSDITSIRQKEECKKVIGTTRQDGDYTPVGYAFQAACDVLTQGNAEKGDAGILLISDFRVTGQRDSLEYGYNFQSLIDAEAICAENEWPVYTLELDFDRKNNNPEYYTERIAKRLRTQIPEKAGYGEYVPMTNTAQAQDKFAEIFKSFFDPNNKDDSQAQTQVTDENGIAQFPFSVGDMVAEINVILTCDDADQISSIEVGRGESLTSYDLDSYEAPIQDHDRIITKEKKYITIKIMIPEAADDWKVVAHGTTDLELGMYALSIHDMNIHLTADKNQVDPEKGMILAAQGKAVSLGAVYLYDGRIYHSDRVYAAYPAVLQILETGEQIPMTAEGSEYSAEAVFENAGTYTVKAVVSGDTFRTGSIESQECVIQVEEKQEITEEPAAETETEVRIPAVETETESEEVILPVETEEDIIAPETETESEQAPVPEETNPPVEVTQTKKKPISISLIILAGSGVIFLILIIGKIRGSY